MGSDILERLDDLRSHAATEDVKKCFKDAVWEIVRLRTRNKLLETALKEKVHESAN